MHELFVPKIAGFVAGVLAALTPLVVPATPELGTWYPHQDHLGNVVAVSDSAGNVTSRLGYRSYGAVQSDQTDGAAPRFTGKPRDVETGLYYFGARYLDAGLGRFLSADPARQIRSSYVYAGASPLANVDRDGRTFTPYELSMFLHLLAKEKFRFHGEQVDREVTWGHVVRERVRRLELGKNFHNKYSRAYERREWIHKDPEQNREFYQELRKDIVDIQNLLYETWQEESAQQYLAPEYRYPRYLRLKETRPMREDIKPEHDTKRWVLEAPGATLGVAKASGEESLRIAIDPFRARDAVRKLNDKGCVKYISKCVKHFYRARP